MVLTTQQALKVEGRKFTEVEIPELGGKLKLASFSAGASLKFQSLQKRQAKGEDVNADLMLHMVKSACVDDSNTPMFDDASALAFIDRISLKTLTIIMRSIPEQEVLTPGEASKATQPAA